jgi:hypothetical protein
MARPMLWGALAAVLTAAPVLAQEKAPRCTGSPADDPACPRFGEDRLSKNYKPGTAPVPAGYVKPRTVPPRRLAPPDALEAKGAPSSQPATVGSPASPASRPPAASAVVPPVAPSGAAEVRAPAQAPPARVAPSSGPSPASAGGWGGSPAGGPAGGGGRGSVTR